MTINHEFARILENARTAKKLTQKQVADFADTSVRQLEEMFIL